MALGGIGNCSGKNASLVFRAPGHSPSGFPEQLAGPQRPFGLGLT